MYSGKSYTGKSLFTSSESEVMMSGLTRLNFCG